MDHLTAQAKFTQNLTPDSTITFGPDPGFMNARSEVIVQYAGCAGRFPVPRYDGNR